MKNINENFLDTTYMEYRRNLMTDYGNRRKEARKNIVAFTLVYDLEKNQLLGYLRDLTLSGARVSGKKPVELNTQLTLSIELPDKLAEIAVKKLELPALARTSTKVIENPVSYENGFEFTNLQPEQAKIIEKFLERHRFQSKEY